MDDKKSQKEKKPASKKHEKNAAADLELEASFSASLTPLENKTIINFIESFSSNFGEQLSALIGKKIEVEFESLESIKTQEIINTENEFIISTFSIDNQPNHGLILFDKYLLDLSINYLFGYDYFEENKTSFSFGKCSLKIAKLISNHSLSALTKVLSDYIDFKATLLKTSTHFKDIIYQNSGEKCFEFLFKVKEKNASQSFKFFLPEKIIEEIIYNGQPKEKDLDKNLNGSIGDRLKNEMIDTTINMIAVLPDIKLKFSDIMNLKSGDLIPIANPNEVELRVGNKKIFKAMIGQANSFRVVKTVESYSKK